MWRGYVGFVQDGVCVDVCWLRGIFTRHPICSCSTSEEVIRPKTRRLAERKTMYKILTSHIIDLSLCEWAGARRGGGEGVKGKSANKSIRNILNTGWITCMIAFRAHGRCDVLMVCALDFGLSGLGSRPVRCSWARHLTLTVPLSTQVYKWVPANLLLGVTRRWTKIPYRTEERVH